MKRLLPALLLLSTGFLSAQTLTVTPTVNNVTCFGANNGSASVAVSGCTGTPTYVWSPNVSTTNSASNLAPGSYTVTVTTPATSGSDTIIYDNFNTAANWTLNSVIGSEGGTPNLWVINSASASTSSCAGTPIGGNSLHITCGGGIACSIFAPNGEAAYNAGGAANVTDRMVFTTNNISTVGRTNVQVKFTWRCRGEGSNDYATLRYSIDGGTNWIDLPTIYSANNAWLCETVTLPATCENISTLKIGFRWRNNGNNAGNDPPMNIDNFLVRADGGGSGGSGCTGSTTFTITEPASALSLSNSSQTNVLCNGGNTGTVTVAGAGGTVGSGYQYNINGGTYGASPTFSNLTAGTYTIGVRDANNCTSTLSVTITQPTTPLSVSVSSQTQATCGSSNGSVTVAGAGGTTAYQYNINGGTYQGSPTFGSLAAGTYTVGIKDANNCTSTVSVTITSPGNVSVSNQSQTNVLCNGGNTGSVTVAGSGGSLPYQYKIGNGPLQSSGTFSGLTAGTYTITVQDNSGCTSTVSVTITQPTTALSVTNSSQTNVLCNGGNTGSVTVAGAGGSPSYQYKIGNGSLQASPTFSGLTAGTYTITVQDANNCTSTLNVTITQPATAVSVSNSSQTNVSCNGGNNGSVTVAGSGGSPGYQYKIGSGSLQASPTFSGLTAGSYVVTVQDNNGCTSTLNVTITQPTALSVSISSQTPATCGNSNGSVTVAGAGGTTTYQYNINGGTYQGSATFGSLAAGTYTVGIKDANNCTSTVSVTITSPGNVSVSNQSQSNVSCNGGNNGSITVAGSGGTPTYQFNIDGGTYQASPTFSGLTAGTYVIGIKDGSNCTSTVTITVTQPASAVGASVASQTPVGCNGTLGSVTLSGTGGTSPYEYQQGSGTFQSSPTFTGLTAGSYTFTVRDDNGCTTTQQVTIGTTSPVTASINTVENVSCNGQGNGSALIDGTGGSSALQYSIDNGATFGSDNMFELLDAGSYSVIVKDNAGCADTVTFTITEPAPYVPTTSVTGNVSICDGGSITIDVTSANSNGCAWSGGSSGGSITVTAPGTYNVTCTDNNNCTGTSADIVVGISPLPSAASSYSQVDNFHIQFNNQSQNATDYTWIFPGGAQETGANPLYNFPSEGTYTVTLIAENACGSDTFELTVLVQKLTAIDETAILNSFTMFPNPANGQTVLQMEAAKPVKGQLQITTALGQLVYAENVSFNTKYTHTIDISKMAAGIYIVGLATNEGTISRKLVIK